MPKDSGSTSPKTDPRASPEAKLGKPVKGICGMNGCILVERHKGLCVFSCAQKRGRGAAASYADAAALDPMDEAEDAPPPTKVAKTEAEPKKKAGPKKKAEPKLEAKRPAARPEPKTAAAAPTKEESGVASAGASSTASKRT